MCLSVGLTRFDLDLFVGLTGLVTLSDHSVCLSARLVLLLCLICLFVRMIELVALPNLSCLSISPINLVAWSV